MKGWNTCISQFIVNEWKNFSHHRLICSCQVDELHLSMFQEKNLKSYIVRNAYWVPVTLYSLSHVIFSTSVYHKDIISIYRWKKWVLDKTIRSIVRIGTTFSLTIKPIHFSYCGQICDILKQLHYMSFLWRFSNVSVFGWVLRRRKSRVKFPADKIFHPNGRTHYAVLCLHDFTVHPNTVQPCSSPGVWKEFYALSN